MNKHAVSDAEFEAMLPDLELEISIVKGELAAATRKFGGFASMHEGYAIVLEELEEAWDEIKSNNPERAKTEMRQVAAMALRFLVDIR